MTRSMFAWLSATPVIVLAASCPTASIAQTAPASTESTPATATPATSDNTIRLSDEERDRILNDNTKRRDDLGRGGLLDGVHGEVGVMIGSHGTRGIYGTADVPLGDNAAASVSFESSRFGYRR